MNNPNSHQNEIITLFTGYSTMLSDSVMLANCTSTLIKGKSSCIIVDTRTAWDADEMVNELQKHNVKPSEITHVVCTHGHSDHIGCNHLFLNAKEHIVGHSISHKNEYRTLSDDKDYKIDENVSITSTPGHTLDSISVIVAHSNLTSGQVAICGDLFEKSEDCSSSKIWIDAGSESIVLQRKHRHRMAESADVIVPGHGPLFNVTLTIRESLENELSAVDA